MGKGEFRLSGDKQIFITKTELASAVRVQGQTVRVWIKKGWLTPHYRLLGGRLQIVFATEEVEAFTDWYLPSLESLDAPCERGSHHDRINNLRAKGRRCANMASQANMNKRLGDGEQDEADLDYQVPVTLDRGSAWRRSDPAQPPSGLARGLTDDEWGDGFEGKG